MFITLDKDYYMPGDSVNGSVFFELFNISLQTNLMIKFEGYEMISDRLQRKIFEVENHLQSGMDFSNCDNEQSKLLNKHN